MVYTGPLMETTNVTMLVSDSAKLQIKLTAPLEQQFRKRRHDLPQGHEGDVYSAEERHR